MNYSSHTLKDDLNISKLYTVHYFDYSKDYKFSGESHDFWELVYVDKGEVICTADDKVSTLTQGQVIFHKPNEWHNISSNGKAAANAAIVSFECKSKAMEFFENKILKAGQEQKNLIAKIISEYTNAFSTPLNDVYSNKLVSKRVRPIGSEQLIRQYICEFLLLFLRESAPAPQYTTLAGNYRNTTLNILINYMIDNISKTVTIDDLVKYSGTNRMTVNRIFNNTLGTTPIKYFTELKIDLAKKHLRENNYNISQIAEILGYSSVHYFSLQFKKFTTMSPTEYCASIKAMSAMNPERTKTKKV